MLSAASDGLDALAFNRAPELGTHLLLEFGVTQPSSGNDAVRGGS